jgi:TPR repeat protein
MGQVAEALGIRAAGEPRRVAVLPVRGRATDEEGEGDGVNGVATAGAGGRRSRHAPRPWSAALAAAFAPLLALILAAALVRAPTQAQAQSQPRAQPQSQSRAQASAQPAITLPPAIAAEPASQAAFPIRVGPPDAVPHNSFVRLRGLPPTAALSEGYSIGPGSWAVPLAALPELKITLPAGSTGRSDIVVTLVAIDGSVLAEASSTLAVAAARKPDPKAARASTASNPPAVASMLRAGVVEGAERSAPPSEPVTQATTPQDRERALRLVKKGDEQLSEGNVAAARLFYERAAEAGLAQGAMALAATFDAVELARLGVRGIQPDAKQARRWYERARQLGAGDAESRLRRIGIN